MSLTNAQYDALMRMYSRKRLAHARELDQRLQALTEKYPELSLFREQLSENAANTARAKIAGNDDRCQKLQEDRQQLVLKRDAFLKARGLSEEDFLPRYDCPDCRDTGFIGTRKCHCFLQAEILLLYAQSNLSEALQEETFDQMDWTLYDDTVQNGKPSEKDRMVRIVSRCRSFVSDFDTAGGNLLLYGSPGLGKTFLSGCIARELLDTCHSVLYFSAGTLFESFSAGRSYGEDPQAKPEEAMTAADLLIIDDLGTEFLNSFTGSRFFSLLNERLLRKKSTIISTNLTLNQLSDRYGERTASRIIGSFEPLAFLGDDLRIKIKLRKLNH